MSEIVSFPANRKPARSAIWLERAELDKVLAVYGQGVRQGAWADYAIDPMDDCCIFSIFRRSGEGALWRIEKRPALAARQGAFLLFAQDSRVVKRGHEIHQVLEPVRRSLLKAADQD